MFARNSPMLSLKVNLPHRHFGRVNINICTIDPSLLREAVGLQELESEPSTPSVADVPCVLQLTPAEGRMLEEEMRKAEEDWRKRTRMSEWERTYGVEAQMSSDRLSTPAASSIPVSSNDSSSVAYSTLRSEPSLPDYESSDDGQSESGHSAARSSTDSWLSDSLYSAYRLLKQRGFSSAFSESSSGESSSGSRLSSDSFASSQYDGQPEIAQAVHLVRCRSIPQIRGETTSQDTLDPDVIFQRARTLAVLEETSPSTDSQLERSSTSTILTNATSISSAAADSGDEAIPSEAELDPHVQYERARTLAILTGTINPPPVHDDDIDGFFKLIFGAFEQDDDEDDDKNLGESIRQMRHLHKKYRRRADNEDCFKYAVQPSTAYGMAGWMHNHLWNHLHPSDRTFLWEWRCDVLKVTSVRNLDACTEEEFVAALERMAERGWKDQIWVTERPEDVPKYVANASKAERIAFQVMLKY
ncbi:hypothetical protein NLU13_6457 [Sarocladium strictum]|uniref:Uncharacterized protein n=1 Tax=Sarocladium strictum TaxID=5046 RepID=A0AA39GIC3_SARSR|nr:hypothetical protein NLU13_6457 [Sarocladium strictum]